MQRFPSLEFFEAVRDRLNADPDFQRATQWWDGAVLLRIGDFAVWSKWYKGQIIDLHEGPSPLGFSFCLNGPVDVWRELIDTELSTRQQWAKVWNFGDIATEGDIFESVRMTEATYLLSAAIREVGRKEQA